MSLKTTRSFALVLLILSLIGMFSAQTQAQATSPKTVALNCLNPQSGWGMGQIYLFPSEHLQIDFEDCETSIYIDTDNDPIMFTASVTRALGDGRITFSSDGTYVVSANVTSGDNQGQWRNATNPFSYIYFEDSNGDVSAYLEVFLVNEDVTEISGKNLLSSPQIEFPTTIDSMNQFLGDPLLADCIDYSENFPNDRYVYVETPLVVTTAGDFLIRTISTTPVSGFTNYLSNPTRNFSYTPMLNVSHMIYQNFDPINSSTGFLGCALENSEGGDYLISGEVIDSSYAHLDISLPAGNYTIVSAYVYGISVSDWNSPQYWTPTQGQSVNIQIWGPEQVAVSDTPTLAQTGAQNIFPIATVLISLGTVLFIVALQLLHKAKTKKAQSA